MMDICNITKINRELGHAKGDEVIKTLADKIKQNIRTNDCAGRYGGDEIAVILPNTNTKDATPPMGIVMDIAPYAIMVAAAFILSFAFLRVRHYGKK